MSGRASAVTSALVLAAGPLGTAAAGIEYESRVYLRQPAISSDGTRVAFVHAGDLYEVSADGGEARLLTMHEAVDQRPRYGPKGRWLAFTSERSGGGDVYALDLESGELRRLTHHHGHDQVEDFDPSGSKVYFSSARSDLGGNTDLFAVSLDGGTPVLVSGDRYRSEYNASVSPDGDAIAFNVGDRTRQWWRNGPREDDGTEVWTQRLGEDLAYERVTRHAGKDSWPLWAPEGRGFYYVSDGHSRGVENLRHRTADGELSDLTTFDGGRVLWPDASTRGDVVFERDFCIWMLRPGEQARPLHVELPVAERRDTPRLERVDGEVSEFALAPDGAKVAFVVRGDVFVGAVGEGAAAPPILRVTKTLGPESELCWAPDSVQLFYVARRGPDSQALYRYDCVAEEERRLTEAESVVFAPSIDGSGRRVALRRGTGSLEVLDLESGASRPVAAGLLIDTLYEWSPDGTALAFLQADERAYVNAYLWEPGDAPGGRRVSHLPYVYPRALFWEPNGAALVYGVENERPGERIFRIPLPSEPFRPPDPKARLFPGAGAEPTRHPQRFDLVDGAPQPQRLLPDSPDASCLAVLADGQMLFAVDGPAGRSLWSAPISSDGEHAPRELCALDGISELRPGPSGQRLWYLRAGAIRNRPLDGGAEQRYATQVLLDVDPRAEREATFLESWAAIGLYHKDANEIAAQWRALYDAYLPLVRGARSEREFEVLHALMVGELNTSHVGLRSAAPDPVIEVADLGVDLEATALERDGHHRVSGLVPGGPLAEAGLRPGDLLVAIDGATLGRARNLWRLLEGRAAHVVEVTYRTAEGQERSVHVRGASTQAVAELRYDAWVAHNRTIVDERSAGRLGYVHIQHFGTGSFETIERAIDSEMRAADGIVLDIRHNGGGWAAAAVASFLARRTTHRSTHQDRVLTASATILGVGLVDRPYALLQDETCLSNSESFSEAFRALELGPIVGMPTAAWCVGSRSARTSRGARVSLPVWRMVSAEGDDMDEVSRSPDVRAEREVGESLLGRDSQLEECIDVLLEGIDR